MAVRSRKALNIRVTVPGPVAVDFKVASVQHVFEAGRSVFQVELRNEGNVSTEVTGGKLEVMDASGQVIGTLAIRMSGKFLARDTVLHPVLFDQPLPEGRYSVRVSMDYGGDEPATWESTFEVAKEAAEKAEEEATDRGFDLPSRPGPEQPEQPNYRVYVILGLIVIAIAVGLIVIAVAVGLTWLIRRSRSKGDGGDA